MATVTVRGTASVAATDEAGGEHRGCRATALTVLRVEEAATIDGESPEQQVSAAVDITSLLERP